MQIIYAYSKMTWMSFKKIAMQEEKRILESLMTRLLKNY